MWPHQSFKCNWNSTILWTVTSVHLNIRDADLAADNYSFLSDILMWKTYTNFLLLLLFQLGLQRQLNPSSMFSLYSLVLEHLDHSTRKEKQNIQKGMYIRHRELIYVLSSLDKQMTIFLVTKILCQRT